MTLPYARDVCNGSLIKNTEPVIIHQIVHPYIVQTPIDRGFIPSTYDYDVELFRDKRHGMELSR